MYKKIVITLIILILVAGGIYYFRGPLFHSSTGAETAPTSTASVAEQSVSLSPAEIAQYRYTEAYHNDDYHFSFKYPSGFTVTPFSEDGHDVILVQKNPTTIGIQIVISPFEGGDVDVTVGMIHTDLPDLKIDEPQELLVGTNKKGLAFVSDNKDFGGKSREVWFVFGGHLFQISTYLEYDALLKGLFGTWNFDQ